MNRSWHLEYDPAVVKWLRKADPQVARRLRDALRAVETLEDPRVRGKALTGSLAGLWRYRVGDYRIICDLIEDRLVVLVIDIDHRSRIYTS
ncbi:hypothetical protein KEM60_02959 [Austwickia sp. TVS 96-490-7B]|uniref:type II toxin-antitoxin system RelE family toxin n=1 Tax=Austwickia sp. TVS 96-490-7B TaxID=2830843 RepID=UPI001DB97AC8|nr:type II toxin-antitoxin system RelE/ParE family toxin [Austwickia sp. TVS 96-490-7B]MBW3086730.1 hypothetical protein [Austwickia sp. TVS 96-490-7B]